VPGKSSSVRCWQAPATLTYAAGTSVRSVTVSVTFSGLYTQSAGRASVTVKAVITPAAGDPTTIQTNSWGQLPDTELDGLMFEVVETVYSADGSVAATNVRSVAAVAGQTIDLSRDVGDIGFASAWSGTCDPE
jgi:hypothetical protein